MQIPVIKTLVEQYTIEQLKSAEACLLNEQSLPFHIEGHDEGEQLTHVLAAIFIKEYMAQHNADYTSALRAYTQKVRNAIN